MITSTMTEGKEAAHPITEGSVGTETGNVTEIEIGTGTGVATETGIVTENWIVTVTAIVVGETGTETGVIAEGTVAPLLLLHRRHLRGGGGKIRMCAERDLSTEITRRTATCRATRRCPSSCRS